MEGVKGFSCWALNSNICCLDITFEKRSVDSIVKLIKNLTRIASAKLHPTEIVSMMRRKVTSRLKSRPERRIGMRTKLETRPKHETEADEIPSTHLSLI
jgi:hypothetical protein